ncbi:MAG: PDZ domain-containing protein [Chloroflexaceae bacterium]|nr:PDZ domain-containing protein [Chloroflexaceae bacterium]
MSKRAIWMIIGRGFWVLVLLVVTCWWGPPAAAAHSGYGEEQKLLLQSWRIVNQAYLDETFNHHNWWLVRQQLLKRSPVNREETYGAIREMLAMLDDPFTRLLEPSQYRSLQISTAGELSGVGLQINLNPQTGYLEVVAPIPGSPAAAAGIGARDRILAIDGVDTTHLSLEEAALKLRGIAGTQVSVKIQALGADEKECRDIILSRDRIALNSVYAKLEERAGETDIGYMRLTQFSATAAQEMSEAIARLQREGADGFVLDLRNNPGGLLQAGIEVARLWLGKGTVVYTVNRQGLFDSFDAYGSPMTAAPLVILVNQGTASASEILAGALQDNGRAVVVGEQTFGKGLIQSLFELSDGSGLAVTVAKYETPNHHDINKLGITPDYLVPLDGMAYLEIGSDRDEQYQQAVQLLTDNLVLAEAGEN